MAQISWTGAALATFSPEELACAAAGGSWNRSTQTCTYPPSGLVTVPGYPVVSGQAQAQQSGAGQDDLVYTQERGWWPRYLAENDGLTIIAPPGQTLLPTSSPPSAAVIPGGSVLGVTVPAAPAVLLPSFVGGRLGEVRDPGGMRPLSGGRPERVRMGPNDVPVVRMKSRWDLQA